MTATIHDVEQGTDSWLKIRSGIPTASQFGAILSSPSGRSEIPVRTKYLYQLAYEIISGEPLATYTNAAMARGREQEPHARSMFEFLNDAEVKQVGFVTNDALVKGRIIGCSPDGFVGENETIEIKSTESHLLIDRIIRGGSEPSHMAQVQGGLWVCERQTCHLLTYTSPKLPLIKRRFERDEQFIARLKLAVEVFCEELDEVVDKIKRYGGQP